MTVEIMRANLSEKQEGLLKNVIKTTEEFNCFMCEGVIFKGDRYIAALEFAYNNPNGGDFYVWLQDNYKMIRP